MYIYFDSNGVLKEIITEKNFRQGDSQRDKIYIYWEGEHSPISGWIKYKKADGELTTEAPFSLVKVGKELPTEPVRNLKYFSYDHTYIKNEVVHTGYEFYQLTVPDTVLSSATGLENSLCIAVVRFTFESNAMVQLGVIPFSVETSIGILTDSSINETQYNYLISLYGELYGSKADKDNTSQNIKANKITVNKVASLDDNRTYIDFEQEAGFVISTPNDDFFVNSQTGGIVGRDTYNGTYYAFRLEEGKFNITGTGIHYYENGNQMATQTYVDSTTGHTIELSLDSTNYKITAVLKNSSGTVISTSSPIDLPLESVVVSGTYDDTTKKVILTLQNGSTIDFSVADLIDGLQPEITAQNKLSSDLVNDVNYITLSKTITSFNDVMSADASGYLTQDTFERIDENTRIDFTITATDDNISMTFRLKMLYSDVNGYAFGAYQFFENAGIVYETMMNCNIDPTNYAYEMHFEILEFYTKDSVDGLVKANPTLAGTEADLTGLEVNGVKYKVPSGSGGGSLYRHQIHYEFANSSIIDVVILNNSSTPFTTTSLVEFLSDYSASNYYLAQGICVRSGTNYNILGVFKFSNPTYPFGVVYTNSLTPQNTGFTSPTAFTDTVTEV